jgi:molybdopterin-biosynthesis enzyme MoeA-like protein
VGDDRAQITAALKDAFASGDVVFSTGGIGATPDDHTRQCAAAALGVDLALQEAARALILERMQDIARENNKPYEPDREDNVHRLNMGVFPVGATIIANPYNKIPGFTCESPKGSGRIHFVPGFPVMAWPMIENLLDTTYKPFHQVGANCERSLIVYGAMEASLTPLMERIEADFAGYKVFSLPSVDHPVHGRHIELGVKGQAEGSLAAYEALKAGLLAWGARLGPEMVR